MSTYVSPYTISVSLGLSMLISHPWGTCLCTRILSNSMHRKREEEMPRVALEAFRTTTIGKLLTNRSLVAKQADQLTL